MKPQLIHLSIIITAISVSFSSMGQSADYLTINNIRARIDANSLFMDQTQSISSFECPSGSGLHSIFAASLWLSGIDVNSVTKTNVNTYYNATQKIAGPIMSSSFYASEGILWDKVWKVECQQIQEFVAWYQAGIDDALNGTTTQLNDFPSYQIPAVILNWPGNGDVAKGQAYQLAPFFDRDSDNFYDPTSGDYPLVKGDQAIFFIYNDERPFYAGNDTHAPMKTEVHGMAYAFSSNDAALNNTVFLNYKIYNRGTATYNNSYIGFWADLDLGNSSDDFMAADVDRSSFYVYNGDNNDEDANGALGYQSNLPAQSVTFLKGAKQDNDGNDNAFGIGNNETINGLGFGDGIPDNEHWGLEGFMVHTSTGPNGSPSNEADFYNYLSGNLLNGTPLTHPTTGTPSKYMFPGITDSYNYGTNGIAQIPWPASSSGDKKGFGSSGPFTFQPGTAIEIDLALVFGRDMTGSGNLAGVAVMQEHVDSIRSYYANGMSGICDANGYITGIAPNKLDPSLFNISPNPFNNEVTINYSDLDNSTTLEVYNLIGKKVLSQKLIRKTTVISLTEQASGIYFVSLTNENGRISEKIIKK